MRKQLRLVSAIWKTNRPFDKDHYPWLQPTETQDDMKMTKDVAGRTQHKAAKSRVAATPQRTD